MVDGKTIMADFQFLGNRVSSFNLETSMIESRDLKAAVSYDFNYNVLGLDESNGQYFGLIEFIVKGKAKIGRQHLFKFDLVMEGAFIGNPETLTKEAFEEMLQLNGIVTLSQISRSFLLSVTSQSGINPPVKLPMINVVKLKEQKKQELEKAQKK